MASVKITYETLFDLLRREKSRSDLQDLDQTFFVDVMTYIQEKKITLADSTKQGSLSSSAEREKINIQIKNIKKILEELYDLRQKKIINLAVHKTKTNSSLIDTSKMLIEEKALFEDTCQTLLKHKDNILGKLLRNELPKYEFKETSNQKTTDDTTEVPSEPKQSNNTNSENTTKTIEQETQKNQEQTQKETPTKNNSNKNKVKILSSLPKFVGLDKKIYGPFKTNEEVELPQELIDMLVKKGRAKLMIE
ncbi:hypothetical protein K9L67_00735 [Candidatus Woesearchaeota archaeon]|nr:hypothetical protein [Candidatus Woesearchaeota archaeon]MCF7900733.1 hypothetical protein [Candidatus Woesearchaeota archaeon]MCF8013254.1 hypothetical protein [Candidatus Woesearchaeota archaeon]